MLKIEDETLSDSEDSAQIYRGEQGHLGWKAYARELREEDANNLAPESDEESSFTHALASPPNNSANYDGLGLPSDVPVTNFQAVKQWSQINGTYIIDPSLEVPEDLISNEVISTNTSDRRDYGRKNLFIECTGGHDCLFADIWLINSGNNVRSFPRANIEVIRTSMFGDINVKIHTPTSLPFTFSSSLLWGNIYIYLPRDFVGPLTLHTGWRGSIDFSKAVESRLVTFSNVDNIRKCFVGDIKAANYTNGSRWFGSSVDIRFTGWSAAGNVSISFVD